MNDTNQYLYKKRLPRKGAVYLLLLCFLLFSFRPFRSLAAGGPDPAAPYDEILIFMSVQGAGSVQIPAAIRNESAYLSVTDVFDFLKIRNTASAGLDSITGFFISPKAVFVIDKVHNRIEYQGKIFDLPPDAFIRNTTSLYLRSEYFGQVFGLQCKFNFRSLSVILSSNVELPVIREMRQEAMRNNLGKLKGEVKADTTIFRSYPMFRFGMTDWFATRTKDIKLNTTDTRLNLALGGVVAGGETNVSLNYRSTLPLTERQQYYQWRYVNNDNKSLRQVLLGKTFTPSISSIYSPVVGVQFTNAPTTYRRSFGSYTLPYFVEAGWIAELYVNNTLVDYAKAEITGMAHFQVPLVYGNSIIKIRFYSPWGEERSSEQNMLIPFNFLPKHEFEYTVNAGVVEDTLHSKFGRVTANYGLTERLTIGAGMEYLSSITTGKSVPFANASLRLSTNLLLSADYAYGVRSKFIASYHSFKDLQIELNYTRYREGQRAINNNFLEERKAIISYPFRSKKFILFSKLSAYQIVFPVYKNAGNSKNTTIEGLLSGSIFGLNTNFDTYAITSGSAKPYIYSTLSVAFRLPAKIVLTPQVQYEYNQGKIIDVKVELGKYITSHGYINVFYENNYKNAFSNAGIGFRYDFSFAVSGLSFTRGSNGTGNNIQSASGSVLYDDVNNSVSVNNRANVGNGAIKVMPYLDINGNGRRDSNEPGVDGVGVSVNGGRTRFIKPEKSIQVTDLEAYTTYTLRITESFNNVAWHIRNKIIRITIDPNHFKIIEVPVTIANEVAGMVYLKDGGEEKPLARILIDFYNPDFSLAGETVTEGDGSFSFTGLAPGDYTARVNTAQLEKLKMRSLPISIPLTITTDKNGAFVDGLKFILVPIAEHTGGISDLQ